MVNFGDPVLTSARVIARSPRLLNSDMMAMIIFKSKCNIAWTDRKKPLNVPMVDEMKVQTELLSNASEAESACVVYSSKETEVVGCCSQQLYLSGVDYLIILHSYWTREEKRLQLC